MPQGSSFLNFQPQYDYSTGALIGAEALVRWKHPEKGLIPPCEFLPYAEKTGFVFELDLNIWEQVCALLRRWMDVGLKIFHVSVNVSRNDLDHQNLVGVLLQLVEKYRLPKEALRLEITESAYMDCAEHLLQTINALKEAGFLVEMDDFGSGYSSLHTLKKVPVDLLKLDMKFLETDDSEADAGKGGNILSAVVHMAHSINLPVIAEGVETLVQAEFLKSIGCLYMQGYFFSKPLPLEQFEQLLRTARQPEEKDDRFAKGVSEAADFLDGTARSTLLFNSFVGGAGIFEYSAGKLIALRLNDRFLEMFRTSWEKYKAQSLNLFVTMDPERRGDFVRMFERAIKTGEETSCYHSRTNPDGTQEWFYNRARFLVRKIDGYIFYISAENVTEQMELAQMNGELNHEISALLENIPGGVLRARVDRGEIQVDFISPSLDKMLGYERGGLLNIVKKMPLQRLAPKTRRA